MGDENQTLRELIRARKKARPNKQNWDSDTDSSENTAKNENFANGDNTAEIENENLSNQNTTNLNNQNLHLNLRDYDKDPLILRDYSCGALGTLHLFVIVFWIVSVVFIFDKTDDYYVNGYKLDMSDIVNTIAVFSFISAVILICISLWLSASVSSGKVKYTYYYNSKVVEYSENKEAVIETPITNSYRRYTMHSASFIDMIYSTFNLFLSVSVIFIFILFINMNFMGIFLFILISLITALLEILAYMPMYKKINGNLKNFWKYSRKLVLNLELDKHNPEHEVNDDIYFYLFDQKKHDEIRDYILRVFFHDIDDKF